MKRLPALAAAATVLLTITACGSSTPGTDLPTTGTATSTTTGNGNNSDSGQPTTTGGTGKITSTDQLYNTQACTLLTTTEATQLGLPSTGQVSNAGAKSGCIWSGSEYIVSVDIRTDVGINNVNAQGGTLSPTTVGNRQATQAQDNNGWCMYAMKITDSSRVDVGAQSTDQPSCQEALSAAQFVEQKLP